MDYLDPSIPILIRTARSILDWSQVELAKRSGVAFNTIGRIERCETSGRARTVQKLLGTFEAEGLTFQMDGISFGLAINGDLAIQMRKQARDQQLSEGGLGTSSVRDGPALQTRVRKRRLNVEGQKTNEVPQTKSTRKRVLKIDKK